MNASQETKNRIHYQGSNKKKTQWWKIMLSFVIGGGIACAIALPITLTQSCHNKAKNMTVFYSSDHYYFTQYDNNVFIKAPVIEIPNHPELNLSDTKFTNVNNTLNNIHLTLNPTNGSIYSSYQNLSPFDDTPIEIQVEGNANGEHYETQVNIKITCDDLNTIFDSDNCLSPDKPEFDVIFSRYEEGTFIDNYDFSTLATTHYTSIDFGANYFEGSLFSNDPPKELQFEGQIKGIKFGDATSGQTGKRVIHDRSFQGCDGINLICLPPSLTAVSIGNYAFWGCSHLYGFIGGDLNTKHSGATISSILAGTIDYPAIGDNAFYGCSSLTSELISNLNFNPNDLQYIENASTSYLEGAGLISANGKDWINGGGLIAGDLGSTLTSIDFSNIPTDNFSLFTGCSSLTAVNLAANTSLSSSAGRTGDFEACYSLFNVKLPSTYSNDIAPSTFQDCYSLQSLNSNDDDLIDLSNFNNIGGYSFMDCSNIWHIKFSSSLTTISPTDTFSDAADLKIIIIDATSAPSEDAEINISYLNILHGVIIYTGDLGNAMLWKNAFGLNSWTLVGAV